MVSLPALTGAEAALTTEEQQLVRKWAGNHPLLLQLAGSLVWEARQQGQDISWVKDKFEQVARRVPRTGFNLWKWWRFGG